MDERLNHLIINYLQKNYPVIRLKHNGKFKRSIILDDGTTHHFNDITHNPILIMKFIDSVCKIFCCEESTARIIVKKFLNIK